MSEMIVSQKAHEVKTPLNTIMNMLVLLQQKKETFRDPDAQKWILLAKNSSDLLLYII